MSVCLSYVKPFVSIVVSSVLCHFKLALPSLVFLNTSDSKASSIQQRTPETKTDTQGEGKFYQFLHVKCSYSEIFIVVN